jgi:hypothetical protein
MKGTIKASLLLSQALNLASKSKFLVSLQRLFLSTLGF